MKNRNNFNPIKTLVFSIFMLMLSVIMNRDVFAETFVIDENSTYVDIDGVEKKYMTIRNNKWIGFQGCLYLKETYGENNDVKIVVPKGVVSMGCEKHDVNSQEMNLFFDFCLPIEIVLPKTCKTINHMDFVTYHELYGNCNDTVNSGWLEDINLENVQYINEEALGGTSLGKRNNGLLDLTFSNIKIIGAGAFRDCDELKKVIVGAKTKTIDIAAFMSCANLTYVELKYGVKTIKEGAFKKAHKTIDKIDPDPNYNIKVLIPASVTKIDKNIFLSDYSNQYYLETNPKAKIITPKNSYAHKWAKKNDIKVQVFNVKKPSNVSKLRATEQTQTSVKLTYKAGANAEVYEIYQLKSGSYKKIATTSNLSYTVKKLKAGTVYKFKVVSVNETKSSAGKVISTATQPKKAVIKKISVKNKKVTLSWKKVKGATGYEIYRSTDGKTFELVKDTAKLMYTSKRMKKGNYMYKVRAYIKVGKNKIYGADSKVKEILF